MLGRRRHLPDGWFRRPMAPIHGPIDTMPEVGASSTPRSIVLEFSAHRAAAGALVMLCTDRPTQRQQPGPLSSTRVSSSRLSPADALQAWAPELFYDEATEQYMIFWSTATPGRFPASDSVGQRTSRGRADPRLYYVTTKDFRSYSPARLLYDGGFATIDGTITKSGDSYYLVMKYETFYHASPSDTARRSWRQSRCWMDFWHPARRGAQYAEPGPLVISAHPCTGVRSASKKF